MRMRRRMDKVKLRATGFIEGENIIIEWRWAGGQYDRLSSPAGEPVGRDLAVLVTFDAPASFAARAAPKTTPIVFLSGADPVEIGLEPAGITIQRQRHSITVDL